MLGRLDRGEDYKGHKEVIAVWQQVVERVPGAELWIAGDGDMRKDLEAMVLEKGLAGKVKFLGFVSEERK